MKKIFLLLCLMCVFALPVYAEEATPEPAINESSPAGVAGEDDNVLEDQTGSEAVTYAIEFPSSIGTYEVNPDDYNVFQASTYAITGDVYPSSSYNSTVLSIWNGLLANNVGKDYVAWRSSQYDYYIVFGENFTFTNGVFSGSGDVYHWYTYGNNYSYDVGTDSFRVDPNGQYLYTNVAGAYPALDTERGLIYEQIQTVAIIALLSFNLLRWIFIKR